MSQNLKIRTLQLKYCIVHFDAAKINGRTDEELADDFRNHGPLIDAWDDEMSVKEFKQLTFAGDL